MKAQLIRNHPQAFEFNFLQSLLSQSLLSLGDPAHLKYTLRSILDKEWATNSSPINRIHSILYGMGNS